ncbi:MAG: AAA family ATPase [Arcicella sp.]|nr:AAA family ATPase [Arcicella sp.]
MKLTKIEIKGLFDLFDYEIPLINEENLLIITGPNGFGKTMILNIIDSFFNNRLDFFQKLIFEYITIYTDNNLQIEIAKYSDNGNDDVNIEIIENKTILATLTHSSLKSDLLKSLSEKVRESSLVKQIKDSNIQFYKQLFSISGSLKVHLIKEQRLIKRESIKNLEFANAHFDFGMDENDYIIDTIEGSAIELKDLLNRYLQTSYTTTQQIDSSFPKRLLNEKGTLSINEFDKKFKSLKEKIEKLKRFGLSESEQEIPEYDEKNASVLLVYLKDSEEKISVFNGLLSRLELFTGTLNERRFTFKSIKIDKNKGFIFLTKNDVELKLTDLSSGEQHEVVLLYELIFKTNPNTLVLIDEPEISLHVTWQKEFLSDLLKILELQKMQVIVATHSPQIINDRWDLVFNLETQMIQ